MQYPASNGRILIAPLNWGLGHATRTVPVIRALEECGFTPIIASDGESLQLLKREFPHIMALELPSYGIAYPEKGDHFKWKMLRLMPRMMEAILEEKKIVKQWIREYAIDGIISDNRAGVYSKKVPSVFITHQLNVLTGNTTWLTGGLHRRIISKFSQCWIPDVEGVPNLSGKLGHMEKPLRNVRYIGPLSRFDFAEAEPRYDLMVLLSGPEPQRSMLEKKLRGELLAFSGTVLFVKGQVEQEQKQEQKGNIHFYNFMTSVQLQKAIAESRALLCRSGYTTLMDLAKMGKKAFLIPTPGQFEQEYLAKKLKREGLLPSAKQDKFRIELLQEIDLYPGLPRIRTTADLQELFGLFERKGELRT